MKSLRAVGMLGCVTLAAMLAVAPAQAARKFITIGTAGISGVYYPVGGAICRVVDRERATHGIKCSVQSTGGSIENLDEVRNGELDLAFAQSDWQANAYLGTGVFADLGPNKDLRSLFSLHAEALTIVARAAANIKMLDDLRGKRVNIGNPGSGMRATMDEVMRVKGWGKHFFIASEYRANDQTDMLCGNRIDAFVFATGHPSGAIQEVTSACDARIVDVQGKEVDTLLKEHTYYAPATIPGGMYAGNPVDVHNFGVKATLVTSKNVDDELIYQVVRSVFENLDKFKTAHPILSTLDPKNMIKNGLTAPLHEGAKRCYREVGLLKE